MSKVVYLLHRFPGTTDTFIRREIRALERAGTDIEVVSVWKPRDFETTPELMAEWSPQTTFLLPRSPIAIAGCLIAALLCAPGNFLGAFWLAVKTARPGIRGFAYGLIYLAEAVLAADALKKRDAGHVHNHFGDHSGTVTMLAARLASIPYSISFHGPHVFFDALHTGMKEKVEHATFIRCISHFCRSQVLLYAPDADPGKLKVIHCGLELDKYPYRSPRQEVSRIFCSARLAPEKGHAFLIEAMALLRERYPGLTLRLAGDGPSLPSLEAKARTLGIADRVAFLGSLREEEVTRELEAADLFVLPSLAEGLPVSVMEAMAVGVPAIATNIAGTSELVVDRVTGVLVPPANAGALSEAIATLIEDHGLRLNIAKRGREDVERGFNVTMEATKIGRELRCGASENRVAHHQRRLKA